MSYSTTPISIWIGNLRRYNEGHLVGEWVDLPCDDFESVFERIGVGLDGAEPFCGDAECSIPGYEISEYPNYEELNNAAEIWESLDETQQEVAGILIKEFNESVEDAAYHSDNAIIWYDCDDMADVARASIEECGGVSCLDERTQELYFDYEKFGRDVNYSGDMWDDESWNSFDNATDAAYDLVENMGGVSQLDPNTLDTYFNYKAFGRDMGYEGSFFPSESGDKYIQIIW